jgi:hypothetical protein
LEEALKELTVQSLILYIWSYSSFCLCVEAINFCFFDEKRKEETRVTGSLEAEPVCTSLFIYLFFFSLSMHFICIYIMYLSVVYIIGRGFIFVFFFFFVCSLSLGSGFHTVLYPIEGELTAVLH